MHFWYITWQTGRNWAVTWKIHNKITNTTIWSVITDINAGLLFLFGDICGQAQYRPGNGEAGAALGASQGMLFLI